MPEPSSDWLSPGINAAAELAGRVGVVGAALLIVSLGIAWHLPKLSLAIRGMVSDFYEYRLKRDELGQRMKLEGKRLEADARRELKVAAQKGSET